LPLFSSIAIFLVITVPWHLIAELRAPGFLWSYFVNEHFRRALGTRYPPDYDAVPLWLWWIMHIAWFFPWSVFLPLGLRELPRPREWSAKLTPTRQAALLVGIWAALIMLFFSVESGSRMEYYSFGAWPAIALILAIGLEAAERRRDRWLPRLQAALAVLGGLVAALLGYMVYDSWHVRPEGDISELLASHPSYFYRLSMAHALDLTPQAFADLRVPALMAAAAFLLAFVVSWMLRRKWKSGATLVITLGMVVFFFAANLAYGVFNPHMGSRALAVEINRYLQPPDQVVIYGEFDPGSSIAFYTGRRLLIWNGRTNNTFEVGSHYPDAPHIFLDDGNFPPLWAGAARVFLFVPPEVQDEARKRLPPNATWTLAEIGGKTVYVNHPVRAGQPTLAQAGNSH
jgi:multisubunit Na+/H+ antiporter MnhB subunit